MRRPKISLHPKHKKMDKKGQKDQKLLIRYSESFKQKVVKEVEEGKLSKHQVQKKYDIKGGSTLNNWIKKMGKNHLLCKKIYIETMDEPGLITTQKQQIVELKELIIRIELARLKDESYLRLACEALGEDVETFKKKANSRAKPKH